MLGLQPKGTCVANRLLAPSANNTATRGGSSPGNGPCELGWPVLPCWRGVAAPQHCQAEAGLGPFHECPPTAKQSKRVLPVSKPPLRLTRDRGE